MFILYVNQDAMFCLEMLTNYAWMVKLYQRPPATYKKDFNLYSINFKHNQVWVKFPFKYILWASLHAETSWLRL